MEDSTMPHLAVLKPVIEAADNLVSAIRQFIAHPNQQNTGILAAAVGFYEAQRGCRFDAAPVIPDCWHHHPVNGITCLYCHCKQSEPHKANCPTQRGDPQ